MKGRKKKKELSFISLNGHQSHRHHHPTITLPPLPLLPLRILLSCLLLRHHLHRPPPMKRLVVLLFLVAVSNGIELYKGEEGECNIDRHLIPRPHSVSILEFGAVADGKTVNTVAFQNAIFYLKSFTDKGGAQLYVPSGKWLTGSFNLTSHLTLFLEKDADIDHWKVIDPLPSYGRGIDLPGQRYRSDNGTIDGQGFVWWDSFDSNNLTHSRPHIVEFINSKDIVISNITFLNPPAWTIHPAYCSNVLVQNITALSPAESPYTSGIVPGSGLALGSEMSGGISEVLVENVKLRDSITGIAFLTSKGRGGYIKDVVVTDIDFLNIILAIKLTGDCTSHPDDKYDPEALPIVNGITFNNMVGMNITTAGNFSGILESPFTGICLSNISFTLNPEPSSSSQPWVCSNVSGFSENVSPIPCFELSNSSAVCSTLSSSHKLVAVL
ncbi:Pectin lyase fold [Cynara cardunculus var. scolymus]|uniref:Pectin lyase fold n=1 Tax=Cynara cardunculus var. scolymus TaxID=59895 RepID=A0A103YNS4_CYNCS|nr:Pectin lyase fold [Cynara cardunculus var. scolymus]